MPFYKKPDPFYLSRAWRDLRVVALSRDHHLCQSCLSRGRLRPADVVHHIQSIETHPELALALDNLRSLCIMCHNRLHGGAVAAPVERRARVIKG